MATIDDIPPEILIRIAVLGADLPDRNRNEWKRRTFLCNFSLVCHKWQNPGQSTLWGSVWIGSSRHEELELFCASEATKSGEFVTPEIKVGFESYSVEQFELFFACCRCTRRLISVGTRFDPEILASEALIGK